jgi:DNA-binding IclR family transcriptional regulator
MPRATRSTPEPTSTEPRRSTAVRAAEFSYSAERVLRALEVIVLCPSSAPTVAAVLGVDSRTARRILQTLTKEQYVERLRGRRRAVYHYQPTVRLLAMAAQLAPRLPLVVAGRRAVREIEKETDVTAYVAVPCYSDVLVVAATGTRALRPWATLQANADAAGRVLLAHREPWRRNLMSVEPGLAIDDDEAAAILERGYASITAMGERCGSLAVVVPAPVKPIAALAVQGTSKVLAAAEHELVALLQRTAAEVARESDDRPERHGKR